MMQAGCCCGCSCPSGTPNPSSVTAKINILDCCGNLHRLTRILTATSSSCGACGLCVRYGWNPQVTEDQSCSDFVCTGMAGWSCSNNCSADAYGLISSISLGTDGSTFIYPETPYGYCDNWVISFSVTTVIQNDPNINFQANINGSCVECRGAYACVIYVDCDRTTVVMCKQGSATPLGTYTTCVDGLGDICGNNSGCMSISVVIE